MGPDFVIAQGDTAPIYCKTLYALGGGALNLTGCSVNFVMSEEPPAGAIIDQAATIVNATKGQVSFTFSAGQTASPGRYMGWFLVTNDAGAIQHYPNDRALRIWITAADS